MVNRIRGLNIFPLIITSYYLVLNKSFMYIIIHMNIHIHVNIQSKRSCENPYQCKKCNPQCNDIQVAFGLSMRIHWYFSNPNILVPLQRSQITLITSEMSITEIKVCSLLIIDHLLGNIIMWGGVTKYVLIFIINIKERWMRS